MNQNSMNQDKIKEGLKIAVKLAFFILAVVLIFTIAHDFFTSVGIGVICGLLAKLATSEPES